MCMLTFWDPKVRMSTCAWQTGTQWEWNQAGDTRVSSAGRWPQTLGPQYDCQDPSESNQGTESSPGGWEEKRSSPALIWSENQSERGNHWAKTVTQKSQPEVKTDVKQKPAVSCEPWVSALKEMTPSKIHCHWLVFPGPLAWQLGLKRLEELTRTHKILCLSKSACRGLCPIRDWRSSLLSNNSFIWQKYTVLFIGSRSQGFWII